jgi:hypothetical protein
MNSILELNSNSFKEVKERSLSIVECELQDFKSDFMPKVKLSDPDNPNSDLVVGFCENEQVHL